MPSEYAESIRSELIGLLQDIASPERLYEYESSVPWVNVPSELICLWFDDLYHPDSELFSLAFAESELRELKRFNDCFEEHLNGVSEVGSVGDLQSSSAWKEVQAFAAATLQRCGWHEHAA